MTEVKRGKGRPSKFIDPIRKVILKLAEEGKTDAQIAAVIGVSEKTFHAWKHAHPDFRESLKKSKGVADRMVELALFQRAVGYSQPAIKFFMHEGCVIAEDYTEHYPPDVTACIFWLKNRRPDQWRDVNKLEVDTGGKPIELAYVPKSKRGEPAA